MIVKRYGASALGLTLLALFALWGLEDPVARFFVLRTLAIPWVYCLLAFFVAPAPRWLPLALLFSAWAIEGLGLLQSGGGVMSLVCDFIGLGALRLWERSDAIPLPEPPKSKSGDY